ncbi:MAG: hypothetical protein GX781_00115 [Clostridiales bacterium]|nr:hypothetical protein [Clostridiales bacterium]
MDTQAILDIIGRDAQEAAQRALLEAQDRVLTIQEQSDMLTAQLKDDTQKRAAREAVQLADRMGRLAELEFRKDQLTAKRRLIDRSFSMALDKLHHLSPEKTADIILSLIQSNASGDEMMLVGSINSSFFTAEFVQRANDSLIKLGKPGRLTDSGQKVGNVSGLVLKTPQSELHCTMEALLNDKREALEPAVAAVLFPDNTL